MYSTSMNFYESCVQNIDKYKVSEEVRSELRLILERLKGAAEEIGQFETKTPELNLTAFGSHQCPHCGTGVKPGFNVCSACRREMAWVSTPPLDHAGYTTGQGHQYAATVSGPCLPDLVGIHEEYCRLRATTANLERAFVVLKEGSTQSAVVAGGSSSASDLQMASKILFAKPATRSCPKCQMTISSDASRCPHCTSEISPISSIGGNLIVLGCFLAFGVVGIGVMAVLFFVWAL